MEESRQAGEVSRATWQLELFEKNLTFKTYENEKAFPEEFRMGQMRISDEVTLHVWEGNESARAFYERMGMFVRETTMEVIL